MGLMKERDHVLCISHILLFTLYTVFVQLCALSATVSSTICSNIGSQTDTGNQQIHTSSIYFDLDHRATCNGYISRLQYCYYATNFNGFRDNSLHRATVQIWREDLNSRDLYLLHEHELSRDISQDTRDDFICRNEVLKPDEYIDIKENDIIGVTLPLFTVMPPLQLISTNTTGFGLYLRPLSSGSMTTVKRSSLMWHAELVVHLFAEIGKYHSYFVSHA